MDFNINLNSPTEDLPDLLQKRSFLQAIQQIGIKSCRGRGFNIAPDIDFDRVLKDIGSPNVLFRQSINNGTEVVVQWGDYRGDVGMLQFYKGHVTFTVMSQKENVDEWFAEIEGRLDAHKLSNKRDDGAWIDFTNEQGTGVNRTTQFIHCPGWKDIEKNYSKEVREKMGFLLSMKEPWKQGRLMVWHGPPGTGKTFALRALIMAWKDTFDFVVVTDPECLASNPTYYYEVASKPAKNSHVRAQDEDDDDCSDGKKRVVFILEDSADLIIKESRSAHYDKIGKLLNITDGLIGQGREDIFLVTFNEEIDSIDPAFLRPGRCLAQVEFSRLSEREAVDWMGSRGVKAKASGAMSIAELYALMVNRENKVDLIGASSSAGRITFK